MVYLRALKSWRQCQLSLAHGAKNKEETKNKKTNSLEETVQVIISEGSPGGISETTGEGFVKQVGFEPKVK